MRSLNSIAVSISLALVGACGTNHNVDNQQEGTNDDHGGSTDNGGGDGSGSGTAAACPLGAASFSVNLGLANRETLMSFAVDAMGDVFVAASQPADDASLVSLSGVFDVSAAGGAAVQLPAGTLVAADAQGNIFIAGSFSSRIDFGNNIVLNPMGNIDVFIAKLDAKGHVIFAKDLGLCGDGVAAMVIGKDGRIAISGSAMGTVVVSADGDVQLQVAEFGKIAFDSTGDLVIANSSSEGVQAFVAMYDAAGVLVFNNAITGNATITGIAIDAQDRINLVGFTTSTVDLFGTTITANFAIEPGRVTGAFLAVLDKSCAVQSVRDLGIVEADAIAIDANGQIFIAGAETGNTGFGRYVTVLEVDVRGVISVVDTGLGPNETVNGLVVAAAFDSCGSLLLGVLSEDITNVDSPVNAYVLKIAVQ
jgi:hypothetical protein